MQLELNQQEAATLGVVLEQSLGSVREEIYKTETADYKAALKRREDMLLALLHRLRALPTG